MSRMIIHIEDDPWIPGKSRVIMFDARLGGRLLCTSTIPLGYAAQFMVSESTGPRLVRWHPYPGRGAFAPVHDAAAPWQLNSARPRERIHGDVARA
jgi:hypothetical protein